MDRAVWQGVVHGVAKQLSVNGFRLEFNSLNICWTPAVTQTTGWQKEDKDSFEGGVHMGEIEKNLSVSTSVACFSQVSSRGKFQS